MLDALRHLGFVLDVDFRLTQGLETVEIEWLSQLPQPTAEEIQAAMHPAAVALVTQQIKDEARRRILTFLPEWKQANATARMIEKLAAGEKDDAEWQAMEALWNRVKAIRQHSNTLEAQAAVDPSIDISAGWPG